MGIADAIDALADAIDALKAWKREGDEHAARRDELVRAAREAGLSIYAIGGLSGLSRTTVYKILGVEEDN